MKKLHKTTCGNCDASLDISELEPLTPFKCPGCGNELYSPGVLEHLRLDRPLGRKGCFDAYDGFDAKSNIYVTLLCDDFSSCKECVAADLRAAAEDEASTLMNLSHPSICPLGGCWRIGGRFVVGSPWMDGFDFSEYDPKLHGLLDVELLLDVLQRAALGIAAAHHKGISHHNICPENIHIDAKGCLRLKNFFISRFLYRHCVLNDWRHDFTLCQYMSPEKIRTREEGKPGDIFSFAVLAYFLLTGKYPFRGGCREEEVFARITPAYREAGTAADSGFAYERPPGPDQERKDIQKEISDLIMDMLSRDQAKRPRLGEFIAAVNRHKADMEKDRIYDTQWNMVVTDSDTRRIPKMSRIGPKGREFQKDGTYKTPIFSLKMLFDRKKGGNSNEKFEN